MQLLELSFQGVRGFSPSGRAALQPGYAVLKPPAAGCPLAGALAAMFYADGRGGEAAYTAPQVSLGQIRLTFTANDQNTYRLTRTLGGSGSLERIAPTAAPISEDAVEILQYLRGQGGLPTRNLFEGLFTLTSAQLPSRSRKPAPAAAPQATPALAHGQVAPAADLGEAEARLKALEKERVVASEVDKLQFKLDGLAAEGFELEAKLKSTQGLEEQIARAESDLQGAPTPELLHLPPDILTRCEKYPALVQKRDEALAKVAEEREAEANLPVPSQPPSIVQDQRFWIGVAVGLLALIGGAMADGSLRYVALLDVPAFGFSAVLGILYVDDLKNSQKKRGKGGRLAEREKKINDQFEHDTAAVKAAMKALSVESPQDVAELLGRRAQFAARVSELKGHYEAAKANPEYAAAKGKLDGIRAEQERINAELQQKGGYLRDAREVEREIERVKESIALAKAPRAAPVAQPGAPSEQLADPFPNVMKLAADLWQTDVPTLAAQVKERAGQYLTALTDKRYVGYDFDKDGKGTLLGAAGGRMPAGLLTPNDLDLAYIALRLTIAERAQGVMPLVVDDAPDVLPSVKQPLVGKMLKSIGSQTQVLHATQHPGFAQLASSVVPI